jgi:stage II sporulation protein D
MALGLMLWAPAVFAKESSVRVLLLHSRQPVEFSVAGETMRVAPDGASFVTDGHRRAPALRFESGGRVGVRGRYYRGALSVHRDGGRLAIVNEVPLEDYVAGTLLAEVYGSWEDSVLRAQAVATRTYAMYRAARARGRSYDVEASQLGQVYRGVAAESPRAWRAVRATMGRYLVWRGEPILAAFHSASGGRTASSEEVWGRALPYLISVEVEGEEASPDTYWRTYLSRREVERVLAGREIDVGDLRDLRVASRSPSGRVAQVVAIGSRGEQTLSPRELRRAFGTRVVRSTLFELRREGQGFWVVGSGRGHGVGMSQWGARALARSGARYAEILARFYPGATLESLPVPLSPVSPHVSSGGG